MGATFFLFSQQVSHRSAPNLVFMPVGTYNATKMVELKRERLFEVSTHYVRCTRKNTVFDDFFSQIDQEDHLRK